MDQQQGRHSRIKLFAVEKAASHEVASCTVKNSYIYLFYYLIYSMHGIYATMHGSTSVSAMAMATICFERLEHSRTASGECIFVPMTQRLMLYLDGKMVENYSRYASIYPPNHVVHATIESSFTTMIFMPRAWWDLLPQPLQHCHLTIPRSSYTRISVPRTRRILRSQPLQY